MIPIKEKRTIFHTMIESVDLLMKEIEPESSDKQKYILKKELDELSEHLTKILNETQLKNIDTLLSALVSFFKCGTISTLMLKNETSEQLKNDFLKIINENENLKTQLEILKHNNLTENLPGYV